MELSDYLRVTRRGWRLILGITLVAVVLGAVLTSITPREYRAEAQLFVSTAGGSSVTDFAQGGSFALRQVATYADIVTTPVVLDGAIEDLGLDETSSELAERVVATVAPNTALIAVSVTDENASRAAEIANAVAEEFTRAIRELERVDDSGSSPVKASVVSPAVAPRDPAFPRPLVNLAVACGIGLLVGAALALLRDLLDTRIRGEAEMAAVTEEPILGAIGFDGSAAEHPLVLEIDPHSLRAEAFRSMRTNLIYIDPDKQPRVLLVTSSVLGEGKSTTAANLALTIADAGSRVCLIEGDLRRPRVIEYLGLAPGAGITDLLVGRAQMDDVLQSYVPNLAVLGCGPIPPNPSELLGTDAMVGLVGELKNQFDYVIIDGPPLLAVTDSAVLSTVADGAIVVVGAGMVKRQELERALDHLVRVGGRVLGIVANRLPVKGPDAYRQNYEPYRPDTELEGRGRRVRGSRRRRSARRSANRR